MKRKLREYSEAATKKTSFTGVVVIGGLIIALVFIGIMALITTDTTSDYEDENEKLDVYAEQLYAALSKGVTDSGARKLRYPDEDDEDVDVNMSEYAYVGAYLEAYKNDIDVEALDQTHKVFYNDSLRSLVVFDNMDKAVEEADLESFKRAANNPEDSDYLQLYEEYANVDGEPGEPKAVESFREE